MAELTLTPLRATSPAQHLTEAFASAEVTGPRAVAVRELPFVTMVGIRAEPGSGPAERLGAALGVRLPNACGGVGATGDSSALWLAPDEWIVVSRGDADELARTLTVALHGEPGSVVDLSANRTTLELTGPSARKVLEKGCPLDLHPRAFAVGSAYATTLAAVPVVLWRTDERTFKILVRSSFADHVGRWLVDAMLEFASPTP